MWFYQKREAHATKRAPKTKAAAAAGREEIVLPLGDGGGVVELGGEGVELGGEGEPEAEVTFMASF
jgi:hypothetical protein